MRKEFVSIMEKELASNPDSVLILGDIGVFSHRHNSEKYPERVFNLGILEQSMVSFAAGLALEGMTPTIHTIAPFLVERALEQIKVDFGYQILGGNFVSVGASCDYAGLGATHHCPGDVGILLNVPGAEIYVPGTATEFANQFSNASRNKKISYFRLSEKTNSLTVRTEYQKGSLVKKGNLATVLAVGPMLDLTLEAMSGMDVTVLYYNTISPFDRDLLVKNVESGKLFVVEPFYENTISPIIQQALESCAIMKRGKGIPRKFLTNYGTTEEHYDQFGLTPKQLRLDVQDLIHG